MAELKIPVQIDGFKCVEEMAQAVLNYTYKGKMLQEWADSISNPKTNADRIRSMTDEELAEKISGIESFALTCGGGWPPEKWLNWLRQEVNK